MGVIPVLIAIQKQFYVYRMMPSTCLTRGWHLVTQRLRTDTELTAPVISKCHQFLLIALVLVQPMSLHSRSVLASTCTQTGTASQSVFNEFDSFQRH